MSENEKNVPKRRFKEFEDAEAWEQRKLCKIADFSKGRGYSKNNLVEVGTPIILYGRLYTKYQTVISEVDTFALANNGSLYSNGTEVIVPASGETAEDIARAAAIAKPGILLGGDLNVIYPNDNINSIFLALTISNGKRQKELSKRAQGKSVVHLHNSDLKELDIFYPSKKEQIEISSFFTNIDNLITLHQRKLENTKALKKAYITEMCPAEGERKPKLRFAGFTDNWEQRKVKEIFQVTRGYVLAATETINVQTDEKPYPVYSSQTKNNGLMGYYKKYIFENAVTWTTDGANAGTVCYRAGKFYSTNVCGVLLSEQGYANKMIAEELNNIAWKHVSKVGNPKLMNNVMSEISITLPKSMEEQEKISELFARMDHLVTLYQRKLEKLQNIKKAYLNEMFI